MSVRAKNSTINISPLKHSFNIVMKFLIFNSFILLFSLSVYAQRPAEFQNIVNVATVSPDAASFGKFGNVPVNHVTGVPSITIPLFEMNLGKIHVPISLDYNSSGIRVDEISSSVGTGWALNGINLLSRNMIGFPDEVNGGYLSAPPVNELFNYWIGSAYGPTKDMQYAQFYSDIKDNLKETEPDVFSYGVIGDGGKFMYRQDGSIFQIPVTNNRIEKIGGDFKITDDKGIIYIFDKKETTNIIGQSGVGNYTSAWRLSKMID